VSLVFHEIEALPPAQPEPVEPVEAASYGA
jgi:hypothetical protein